MPDPDSPPGPLRDVEVPDDPSVAARRGRIARGRGRWTAAGLVAGSILVAVAVAWPGDGDHAQVEAVDDNVNTSTMTPLTDSTGGSPSATTPVPPFIPTPVPFVAASSTGVTVHDGTEVTRISTTAAASAYGIGNETVVFQDALTAFSEFPPTPDGPPRVWSNGVVRDLPTDPTATEAELLDAGMVDGAATALVAESFGGVGPDDTFEELVLVNLGSDARTTIVRRPSWESSHVVGLLLPEGDVVGLVNSEAHLLLVRWSSITGEAVWIEEVGFDTIRSLALRNGEITLIAWSWDADRPLYFDLTVTTYDSDGILQGSEAHTIPDPAGEIATGLACRAWFSSTEIACGRAGSSPVVVSVSAEAFAPMQAAAGSIPTATLQT